MQPKKKKKKERKKERKKKLTVDESRYKCIARVLRYHDSRLVEGRVGAIGALGGGL